MLSLIWLFTIGFIFVSLRQSLVIYQSIARNSKSSCLCFPNIGRTGVSCNTIASFTMFLKKIPLWLSLCHFQLPYFFNRTGFSQRNTGYISFIILPLLCFLFPKAVQWSLSKPDLQVYHLSYNTFERPKMLSNFAFLSLFKFHLIGWGYGSLRVRAALSEV